MHLMSGHEYAELVQGASELERDNYGVKVLLTPDERIVKLIRVKRWYSLSAIYPYSIRFKRNANRLKSMGIPSVEVERVFYCHQIRRHGVIYPLLQGESLEQIATKNGLSEDLLQQLAEFIAMLHDMGIYFRSLHLGNILQMPDGRYGLIDVADMRFFRSPLRVDQRRRNFKHLLRNKSHRKTFDSFGLERFLKLYITSAGLIQKQAQKILSVAETVHG